MANATTIPSGFGNADASDNDGDDFNWGASSTTTTVGVPYPPSNGDNGDSDNKEKEAEGQISAVVRKPSLSSPLLSKMSQSWNLNRGEDKEEPSCKRTKNNRNPPEDLDFNVVQDDGEDASINVKDGDNGGDSKRDSELNSKRSSKIHGDRISSSSSSNRVVKNDIISAHTTVIAKPKTNNYTNASMKQ